MADTYQCGVTLTDHAVQVDSAVANYGSVRVLDGLSLNVKNGSVFALLGPSGCGKTTLISCILGRKKLTSGRALVYGGRPGDRRIGLPGSLVGFMPQDTSLYMAFTVGETFQYFGRLHSLETDKVDIRQSELMALLSLPPDPSRVVQTLSGGQKRRISFAVALLHQPRLLVLDEPTVGVDPVVRQRTWTHLMSLAKAGVTTLITTHYVEEARGADRVAIMREGRVMAEQSPDTLLEQFKTNTLEKVFLQLCSRHDDEASIKECPALNTEKTETQPDINCVLEGKPDLMTTKLNLPSPRNITALLIKTWISMKRNILLLFFIFVIPGFIMFLSCVSIGLRPKNLPIGVYNGESDCSTISEDELMTSCLPRNLGCYFVHALNKSNAAQLTSYTNMTHMEKDAKLALLHGTIIIPQYFSISLLKRFLPSHMFSMFALYFNIHDTETVDVNDKINVSLDMSDLQLALAMQEALVDSKHVFIDSVSSACSDHLEEITLDLDVLEFGLPTLGSRNIDFLQFFMPGNLALTVFFLAMSLTSESFIGERSQGLLERSYISGVRPSEIIISYVISQSCIILVQATIAVVTIFVIFKIPCQGAIVWFIILTIVQGILGMSYGFFISTICSTAMDAIKVTIMSFFPNMLLSGIIWPLQGMPYKWMRQIAWFLPHTASVQGMRDITLRGWGVGAGSVQQGLAISSAWIAIFLSLSWILVGKKLR